MTVAPSNSQKWNYECQWHHLTVLVGFGGALSLGIFKDLDRAVGQSVGKILDGIY